MGIQAPDQLSLNDSQGDGKSESAVKIAKNLVKKAKRDDKDVSMALLEWRNTPDINGHSPAQKLMSRRTRTTMPTAQTQLGPTVVQAVPEMIRKKRQQAKVHYDRAAKPLPSLQIGETVRLQPPPNTKEPWSACICVGEAGTRSYLVQTTQGTYQRNRRFIRKDLSQGATNEVVPTVPEEPLEEIGSTTQEIAKPGTLHVNTQETSASPQKNPSPASPVIKTTRSGRQVIRPARYD